MKSIKIMVLVLAILIIACVGMVFLTKPSGDGATSVRFYKTTLGTITLGTDLPESPEYVTLYRGTPQNGDMIIYTSGHGEKIRQSVISETDAPAAALAILGNYGGLPNDAVFNRAETQYAIQFDTTTNQVIARYPVLTEVSYLRKLDGRSVGGGGQIMIDLGENGELLYLKKIWRTVAPSGSVKVIPATSAFEKLKQGDVINPSKGDNDLNITNIRLGYYEKGYNQTQEYIEPVWIFRGSLLNNNNMTFYVYARQFSDFTATPTTGKAPLTVTFTDTSDASPNAWNWDFGDGTTSVERNPVHPFTTAGAYTVTLKASNDLGSDTMTKTHYILIGKKAIVMQTGTKLDELITTLNALNLDQGIKNSLMQKIENLKAKNTDALKFIGQNKEQQANNMLNDEDNLLNAFMNELDAQSGKAIPTDDAVMLKNRSLEIRELIQEAIATPI